ncbi:tRNA (guanine-N(7)-)-methyltransferase [mine drainage metagenome]|uniref:tRNA (guanine(46)-N(7))-methyltransferase n=1 Tax=mine drainage metagenome TaxID=410659 RepID=A0A1J5QHT8_9ZZZZ
MTNAQEDALRQHWDVIGIQPKGTFDLASIFAPCKEVVLEIGTGMGETTAAMAEANPDVGILAIEVHRPGIGSLLVKIAERQLSNVRIVDGDAITVMENQILPSSLDGVRLYFPDPWPKTRHHKRRIVQSEWLDLVASRLKAGGTLHIATDWEPYAEWIEGRCEANSAISGGLIPRPNWRPLTRFENQGLTKGHRIFDFVYRKKS